MGRELSMVFEACLGLPPGTLDVPDGQNLPQLLNGASMNAHPKEPVAADAMGNALSALARPTLHTWFWPDARPFAVFPSHDVDEVRWSWRRRLLMGARHPRTIFAKNTQYWNFDRVLELERRFGVSSSWYFVADGHHARDPPYSLIDVAEAMRELRGKGHEVGVHGSFLSYKNAGMLRRERDAIRSVLGDPVVGVRQHFLNFEPETTWRVQQDAGFTYDASLALNEASGFRAGMCHPYTPPGCTILEMPLILMDGQLFWHEKFDRSEAIANCERLASAVAARGGLLSLNWHQHTYDSLSFPEWWDVYEHMLKWCLARHPVFLTGEEVWRWWTRRASVSVVPVDVASPGHTWEVHAAHDIKGLTLRALGTTPSALDADAPHRMEVRSGDVFLVFPDLKASSTVTVTATDVRAD